MRTNKDFTAIFRIQTRTAIKMNHYAKQNYLYQVVELVNKSTNLENDWIFGSKAKFLREQISQEKSSWTIQISIIIN